MRWRESAQNFDQFSHLACDTSTLQTIDREIGARYVNSGFYEPFNPRHYRSAKGGLRRRSRKTARRTSRKTRRLRSRRQRSERA